MRRSAFVVAALAALASTAGAQAKPAAKPAPKQAGAPAAAKPAAAAALTWNDIVGDWVGKSYRGKSDSVITEVTTTYKADKTVTMTFPNRPPVSAKVITMGGDSVVVETEKYESITRPGHKTWVRSVMHIANHKASGNFHATFDDGKGLDGHSTSAHKK